MTYREMAIKTVNLACQDLMERAEELIPDTSGITSIEVNLRIPTQTDSLDSLPEVTVTTNAFPRIKTVEKIIDIFEGGRHHDDL